MKDSYVVCNECGKKYIDTYGKCPFCVGNISNVLYTSSRDDISRLCKQKTVMTCKKYTLFEAFDVIFTRKVYLLEISSKNEKMIKKIRDIQNDFERDQLMVFSCDELSDKLVVSFEFNDYKRFLKLLF